MRFLTFFNHQQKRIPADWRGLLFVYIPMHEVAPSAVSTAVITDAMICSVHFNVSFLVIIQMSLAMSLIGVEYERVDGVIIKLSI